MQQTSHTYVFWHLRKTLLWVQLDWSLISREKRKKPSHWSVPRWPATLLAGCRQCSNKTAAQARQPSVVCCVVCCSVSTEQTWAMKMRRSEESELRASQGDWCQDWLKWIVELLDRRWVWWSLLLCFRWAVLLCWWAKWDRYHPVTNLHSSMAMLMLYSLFCAVKVCF